MNLQSSLAESLAVVGVIAPVVIAAETLATGAIDVSRWDQILFIFQTGDIADARTLDAGVQTCDADGTSNAVAITGLQATQLLASATANDAKQIVVAVQSNDLIANAKRYVRGVITGAGGTGVGPVACVALGVGRYGPSDSSDLASVVQVIN
jgi:hypothetical protein